MPSRDGSIWIDPADREVLNDIATAAVLENPPRIAPVKIP